MDLLPALAKKFKIKMWKIKLLYCFKSNMSMMLCDKEVKLQVLFAKLCWKGQ